LHIVLAIAGEGDLGCSARQRPDVQLEGARTIRGKRHRVAVRRERRLQVEAGVRSELNRPRDVLRRTASTRKVGRPRVAL
jgi:hypothetical protein